jgi:hypothetical protein
MKYVSIGRVVYKVDHLKGKGSMALHLEYKESIVKQTQKWEHKRQNEPRAQDIVPKPLSSVARPPRLPSK